MARIKQQLHAGDAALTPALNKLKRDADRALRSGTFSVTEKEITPPSGDKHDYLSIAPYWWPNPNTSNGLPYVRRDGQVNPERDQSSDRRRLDQMIQTVMTLALGYYLIGRDEYSTHAARLIRVWFLDPPSKMNPHLKYAQAVPGRHIGRGAGIIETHNLPELIDAVALLSNAKSWTRTDRQQFQEWVDAYLTWLIDSPEGKTEAHAENNHGTWYDVQAASYALLVGRNGPAKKVMGEFAAKRITKQIEPDGRQPRELARTRSWHYAVFGLEALFNAAAIAEKVGVDLWHFQTDDHRGIRTALDWLLPFATGAKPWTDKQLSAFQPERLAPLLRRAALQYRDPRYEQALGKLPRISGDERWRLINANIQQLK
ncbi:MAG TPA: alginate lyase family protein [Candidatus Binatia bacterium]